MSEIDIFSATKNQPESEWASFKSVGDRVQGVYVGSRQAVDSYNNAQTIFELLDKKRNKLINVAIRNTKKPVLDKMARAFLGQIVGFVYSEDKKAKDGSTFKSIDTKFDPKIFDAEWIKENREYINRSASGPVSTATEVTSDPVDAAFEAFGKDEPEATPDVPFMSDAEYLKGIAELARTKLGVTDVNTVKDRVMEATDLAFTKSNYEEIYTRLKDM